MLNESSYQTAIKAGHIGEMFKDAFTRYGRPELFNPNTNYEKGIFGIAHRIFAKAPIDVPMTDRDDLVVDALMRTLEEKEIKKFDKKKINDDDAIKYFAKKVFVGDLLDQMDKYVRVHLVEQQPSGDEEFTQQEQVENRQDSGIPKDPGNMISNDMNKDIYEFLKSKTSKNSVVPTIFYLLTEQMKQNDIAKKLGLSKGQIAKNKKVIQELVLVYAKAQNDDLLTELVQTRLTASITSEEGTTSSLSDKDFSDFFKEIEKNYSVKKASKRSPSGKTVTIQKSRLVDHFSDEYRGAMIMDDSITASDMEAQLAEYINDIESMDDLIEDDDSIIALRIVNTGTRQKSSFEF